MARLVIGLACGCLSSACGTHYPEEPAGGRISGSLFYAGTRHLEVPRAALAVFAYTEFPDLTAENPALPNASWVIPDPVFDAAGLPYEMENLDPFAYVVFAALLDLDAPPSQPLAVGGYPNLIEMTEQRVEVRMEEPVMGIDIQLYEFTLPAPGPR
jgi:hypothetical protein